MDDIPAGATVWVTFVNGDDKYRDLMINWAYHLRLVNVAHVVIAFDDLAAQVCAANDIPYIRCGTIVLICCWSLRAVCVGKPVWQPPVYESCRCAISVVPIIHWL